MAAAAEASSGGGPAGRARATFRRADRLTQARQFDAVYEARVRKSAGPLTVHGRPNGLEHPRLGLSVGRRVGGAVVRNRVKRRLREAFRLSRAQLPRGAGGAYDLVIGVRAHEPLALGEYARLLVDLAWGVHREWERRAQRRGATAPEDADGRA